MRPTPPHTSSHLQASLQPSGGGKRPKKRSKRGGRRGGDPNLSRSSHHQQSSAATADGDGCRPPPPCPSFVQAWRDALRTWPCHMYAYAAPNEVDPAQMR